VLFECSKRRRGSFIRVLPSRSRRFPAARAVGLPTNSGEVPLAGAMMPSRSCSILRRRANGVPGQTPEGRAEGGALLSQWYLGRRPPTPPEIIAFCDKVRQAVDELLLGKRTAVWRPREVRTGDGAHRGRGDLQFAADSGRFSRALFDWSDPTDALARLRRSLPT